MTTTTTTLLLAAALPLWCASCGDDPESTKARQEIGEAVDATKDLVAQRALELGEKNATLVEVARGFVATEGREFAEKLAARLEGLRMELDALGERARHASAPLREDAERRVAALEAQYAEVEARAKTYLERGGAAAAELQEGVAASVDAMQQAIDEARQHLTSGG
jgi:hypothetical protein